MSINGRKAVFRPPPMRLGVIPPPPSLRYEEQTVPINSNTEMTSMTYVKTFLANKLTFPPDNAVYPFAFEDLTDVEALGNGTFGTVRMMRHNKTNTDMAVKRIRIINNGTEIENNKSMQRLRQEVEATRAASNCDQIVKFFGITFNEGDAWLCMELMDLSLEKLYVIAHEVVQVPIKEAILGAVAVATIKALEHMKKNHHIIHRDVKPSNILLNRVGEIKLCDFGICGYLQDSVAQSRDVGCRPYMAPERLMPGSDGYDVKSDVWSLGISMVEVANGQFPYPGLVEAPIFQQVQMIVYGDPPLLTVSSLSAGMHNFIMSCTIKDRNQRADFNFLKRTDIYSKHSEPAIKKEVGEFVSQMYQHRDYVQPI